MIHLALEQSELAVDEETQTESRAEMQKQAAGMSTASAG